MMVNRNLIRSVVTIVGTAGPVVAKYLRDHPEIGEQVGKTVTKLLRRPRNGPAGLIDTITVLREQVAYLEHSADDAAEQKQAREWSRRLDNLEHAAQMLQAGSKRKELKHLRAQVMTTRGQILAAFVREQAEDAEQRQIR